MGLEFSSGLTFSFSSHSALLHDVVFLFVLLLSFLHYCSLHVANFFLPFSSCCCSPFRPLAFLFVLLSFPLHIVAFLQLFFHFRYKVLHVVILHFALLCSPHCAIVIVVVFLFLEESCITSCILSCKNWDWLGVDNQKPIVFY